MSSRFYKELKYFCEASMSEKWGEIIRLKPAKTNNLKRQSTFHFFPELVMLGCMLYVSAGL